MFNIMQPSFSGHKPISNWKKKSEFCLWEVNSSKIINNSDRNFFQSASEVVYFSHRGSSRIFKELCCRLQNSDQKNLDNTISALYFNFSCKYCPDDNWILQKYRSELRKSEDLSRQETLCFYFGKKWPYSLLRVMSR